MEREEDAAALAEAISNTTEPSFPTQHSDDTTSVEATPDETTQESEEPETHSIAGAEPPVAENQETNRRWAA